MRLRLPELPPAALPSSPPAPTLLFISGTKYLKNSVVPTATAALFNKPNATASPVQVFQGNGVELNAGDSRVLSAAYSGGYVYATMNSALAYVVNNSTINRVRGLTGRLGGLGWSRESPRPRLFPSPPPPPPASPRHRPCTPPSSSAAAACALCTCHPRPHLPPPRFRIDRVQNTIAYFVYNPDTGVNKYSG